MDARLNTDENEVALYLSMEDLLTYYTLTDPKLLETIYYEGSRLYTEIITALGYVNGWDKIADNLYLGKLPSFGQYKKIIESIKRDGYSLRLVVSVVTRDQQTGIQVDSPASWDDENVRQHVLIIPDFTAKAPNESIINTILMMRDCIKPKTGEDDQAVLVHCKAGKGRSPMVCLIYLYFYGPAKLDLSKNSNDLKQDIKKISDYLKEQRWQVDVLDQQIEKAEEVIRLMLKMSEDLLARSVLNKKNDVDKTMSSSEIKNALKEMLISLTTKNAIIRFPTFIVMGYYALHNQFSSIRKVMNGVAYYLNIQDEQNDSSQKKHIKDFFMDIYHAENENWYLDLINSAGAMQDFVEMTTYSFSIWNNEGDKKYREMLRAKFIDDLNHYFAQALHCTVGEIKTAANELRQGRLIKIT